MKKYLKETVFFNIKVSQNEIFSWRQMLEENKPLTPEVVGLLLGKARPIEGNTLCGLCSKPILIEDEYKPTEAERFDHPGRFSKHYHKECYKKADEKQNHG